PPRTAPPLFPYTRSSDLDHPTQIVIRELPTAAVTQRDRGELAGRVVVVAERSTGDRVVDHRELTPVGPPEPSDPGAVGAFDHPRSEEHTSELQSRENLVC